jgi:RNA polymerase sigma-70 factor (ECF subfamily)
MTNSSVFSISSQNFGENNEILLPLLAKAKKGEQAAFGEIYNLYFKKIYQFIFYRVSHKEIAEDLAEEVFLKAFTKLSSVNDSKAFLGWMYQIARNQVIDYYREKKTIIALDEVENTLEYETNVIDVVNLQQEQIVLLKLIKDLPSDQQLVLKLKFFEDLTNTEIAEALNKSEGAIRVIQHRGIAKLQELLKLQSKKND